MREIRESMRRSAEWLLAHQDESGGWADRRGSEPSTLNTAEAIIGLMETDAPLVPGRPAAIRDAVAYLEECRLKEGPHRGAWARGTVSPSAVPDVVRTAFALRALLLALSSTEGSVVKDAIEWLKGCRHDDGGWGFRPDSQSALAPTCFVTWALLEACSAGCDDCRSAVEAALDLIVERWAQADGSYGGDERLRAAHTILVAAVLQAARNRNFGRHFLAEVRALDWLLEHPSQAMKLVEEDFLIDPSGGKGYSFFFMNDALLGQVLSDSREPRHRASALLTQALLGLHDKIDEDGGVYGSHKYSWSVAKALSGLGAAARQQREFPQRAPEYPGVKSGPPLLVFAVLLALICFMLVYLDKFTVLPASFLLILLLGTLLAYGKIGEKTFGEVVRSLAGGFTGGGGKDQG